MPRSAAEQVPKSQEELLGQPARITHPPPPGVSAEEKRALVERVAQSSVLSASPALQAFLRFITSHAIAGTTAYIKEQRIGSEVLGRKADYDPAEDNIVRVRAHELRQRLARYFDTAGVYERVVITIPRGSYVPVFQERPIEPVTASPILAESPVKTAAAQLPVASNPVEPSQRFARAGWIVAAALASALFAQFLWRQSNTAAEGSTALARLPAVRNFWEPFFASHDHELVVVAADATFALWQDVTGMTLNLGEYLGRKQFDSAADPKFRELAARRCTSAADLNVAVRLTELAAGLGGHTRMQYARSLNLHDLQTNNAVLIGSRRSNPWVELFEPRLNFTLDRDAKSGAPIFRNRQPRAPEPSNFTIPHLLDADGTEQREMRSYAHIALLPNLSATGHVLLLEGLNMEGTDAAGEFVTNPEGLRSLLRSLGQDAGKPIQPFEALLDLISVPGGFADTRVIAYRNLSR